MPGKRLLIAFFSLLTLTACKKETPVPEQAAIGFGESQMSIDVYPNTTGINIPIVFPLSENGWMTFIIEVDYDNSMLAQYGEQFEFPTLVKQDDRDFGFLAPDLKPNADLRTSIPMTIHPEKITQPMQIVLRAAYGLPTYRQLTIRLTPKGES